MIIKNTRFQCQSWPPGEWRPMHQKSELKLTSPWTHMLASRAAAAGKHRATHGSLSAEKNVTRPPAASPSTYICFYLSHASVLPPHVRFAGINKELQEGRGQSLHPPRKRFWHVYLNAPTNASLYIFVAYAFTLTCKNPTSLWFEYYCTFKVLKNGIYYPSADCYRALLSHDSYCYIVCSRPHSTIYLCKQTHVWFSVCCHNSVPTHERRKTNSNRHVFTTTNSF